MGLIGTTLVPNLRLTLGLADRLVKDIPPSLFGRMPAGVKTNSPAFCFGHLAIYPDRLLELFGRTELMDGDARFAELFEAGKECVDDPTGTVYPAMDVIMGRFRARHGVVLEVLGSVPDEVMTRENPNEKARDRFPTIGALTAFLVGGHAMMHLGQVSAWRRMHGLGSAM
jgi:hypothetical protein